MDRDIAPTMPVLPRSTPFEPSREFDTITSVASGDRNSVFGHLVQDDGDIAGLVAYSIYKQHKLDWLRAFEGVKGRTPDENELASYIIGEGTPRRLATYRHLAEATLAGNGPEVDGAPAMASRPPIAARGRFAGRSVGTNVPRGTIAVYGLIAVLFVVGLYLALHFTATTR